jgi:hypothetical protein
MLMSDESVDLECLSSAFPFHFRLEILDVLQISEIIFIMMIVE